MIHDCQAKNMPLDDYIGFMLSSGRYEVRNDAGNIVNARSNRTLQAFSDRAGYLQVNLVFSRRVVRRCKVHRVVAIAAWGVEAVHERQVGHRNGLKHDNSVGNLWLPLDSREDSERGLWGRKPPKASWTPCVRCGDPDGRIGLRKLTPIRISGQRFGIDGRLCDRCYNLLRRRKSKRKAVLTP